MMITGIMKRERERERERERDADKNNSQFDKGRF
jgi:hypothetical protein